MNQPQVDMCHPLSFKERLSFQGQKELKNNFHLNYKIFASDMFRPDPSGISFRMM